MKEVLSFNIYGQYLKRTDHKTVVNKARNVLKCKFCFKDDLWEDVDKFALFKNKTDAYNMHLGKSSNVDCIIPWEVLRGKYFRLTIYGGDLITTNEVTIPLAKSGYTEDVTPTKPHSKDIFVEIIESLDEKFDDIVFEDNSLKLYGNGELKNCISLPFVDEAHVTEVITELMQDYVLKTELMEILNGYVKDIRFEDGKLIFD